MQSIPVIDLFAGPGGLNEGFSSLRDDAGRPIFGTAGSFELDPVACSTLRVRETYRQLAQMENGLDDYYSFVRDELSFNDFVARPLVTRAYERAQGHVFETELGKATRDLNFERIRAALQKAGSSKAWALIGGPPCQAYSLAGRSRRTNDSSFAQDHKHFLYKEYLAILAEFEPPIFVMENVKGLLSSSTTGEQMFQKIIDDLGSPKVGLNYSIFSLSTPKEPKDLSPRDFIVKAEEYGVPQSRHRVILVGVRGDLASQISPEQLVLHQEDKVTVSDAIRDMPKLRSGISRTEDSWELWRNLRNQTAQEFGLEIKPGAEGRLSRGSAFLVDPEYSRGTEQSRLSAWLTDPKLGGYLQHETRSHMDSDLRRYVFMAAESSSQDRKLQLDDFPLALLPNHRNVNSVNRPFNDRFNVQRWKFPSSTVVSHIAKDGHYFIHPDASQMRSLTVREAARLQTFPDNYYFMGNRTQQYTQVGNAVPPLLASKIANAIYGIFLTMNL